MRLPIDDLIDQLGNPGKYQIMVFCLLGFNYVQVVFNILGMVFYGSKVSFHCNKTNATGTVFDHVNNSDQLKETCTISAVDLDNTVANHTQLCETGWIYDSTERSTVSEWDLVCEREYLVALASTIFFAGLMFGGFVCGSLADHFGRKPVILGTLYGNILLGVGMYFSPNYTVFVVLRFAQGILVEGLHGSNFTLAMEMFHSTAAGRSIQMFWAVGVMLLSGIWYFIQDWRYIQLAITLPCVLTIAHIWILPESYRWLLTKKKYKAAEAVIRRLTKSAGLPYPRITMALIESGKKIDEVTKNNKHNLLDLIRTPLIRRRSLILFFIWFSISFGYFGLSLTATDLAGNKFLNFFISGAVEIPAYVMTIFVLKRLGRRLPTSFLFFVCGISCITAGFVHNADPIRQYISFALVMVGKSCTAGVYIVFVFTSELYPTVVRNIGFGACTAVYNIGGMAAPQVLLLGTLTIQQMPVVVFGGVTFVAGALTLLLPETANKTLPDTIEDIESPEPPAKKEQTTEQ